MLRLTIARVNGYLCLSTAEIKLARQHIDPAPAKPAAPVTPAPQPAQKGVRV